MKDLHYIASDPNSDQMPCTSISPLFLRNLILHQES